MRDFFERQGTARRKTWQLVVYFSVATAVIVVLASLAIYIIFSFDVQRLHYAASPFNLSPGTWELPVIIKIAALVFSFILLGTAYKYLRLRSGGGSMIAEMLGGRVVYPDSNDFHERRLLNIIEEMAIASGVTVPSVYLLEHEYSINAFAAGYSQEDAVLGVTKGTLLYLTREELQGVVAHEFSHIHNGDMLINIRLQGILHGILILGLIGEVLLRSSFRVGRSSSRSSSSGSNAEGAGIYFMVVGLILLILGYTGVFFGKLIKSAVSRQREFLADASAVQFTRNPIGLSGALKKIGGLTAGSKISDPHASEISHMYFGNGLTESWLSAFSTHPPLFERIKRLEPDFLGNFPEKVNYVDIEQEAAVMYAAQGASIQREVVDSQERARQSRHAFIDSFAAGAELRQVLGNPSHEHLRMARELIENIPRTVLNSVRSAFGARAVIYGLLLDNDKTVRADQLISLEKYADQDVFMELSKLIDEISSLRAELRLPLIDLAVPALKTLSEKQYIVFRKNVRNLVKADRKMDLFEYSLQHVLMRHLEAHFGFGGKNLLTVHSISRVGEEISCILTLLARQGHIDESDARRSFTNAVRTFSEKDRKYFNFLSEKRCGLKGFDHALKQVRQAAMPIKESLISACLECIVSDDKVTIREAELFRVIAEALNCPVPPWLTLRSEDAGAGQAL